MRVGLVCWFLTVPTLSIGNGSAGPTAWSDSSAELRPDTLTERVICADDHEQSYALYLPSTYATDRAWPVIYCFDPAGRGSRPVKLLQEAAERHGYAVVGSNNSRNGPWPITAAAARDMIADVEMRFRIDPRRRYGCGMSGGARAACAAAEDHGFTAVLGCAAGFPNNGLPRTVQFGWFGAVGDEDFNYTEMRGVARELAERRIPHRLALFAGGHGWPPASIADDALAWFDLQAMRAGLRVRDEPLIAEWLRVRSAAAAAQANPGESFAAYQQIVADFDGLADTAAAAQAAATLKDSKPVRRAVAAEKKLRRQESEWLTELYAALDFAQHPPARDVAAEVFSQIPTLGEPAMGRDREGSSAGSDFGSNRHSPALELRSPAATDRFAGIRRLAAELHRQRRDNVAARRVLSHGLSLLERARWAATENDFATADTYLEAITILHSDAPEAYFAWARTCLLEQDKPRARELLRTAVAKGFNDTPRLAQLERELAE